MKHINIFLYFIVSILLFSCNKDNNIQANLSSNSAFRDSAIQYIKSKLSGADFSNFNFEDAVNLSYRDEVLALKVFEKSCTNKFILVYRADTGCIGNIIDLSGLTSRIAGKYNGFFLTTNLDHNITKQFIVADNKVERIKYQDISANISISPTTNIYKDAAGRPQVKELPEVVIVSYVGTEYWSLFWLLNGFDSDQDLYVPPMGLGGGNKGFVGGAGAAGTNSPNINVVAIPRFRSPFKPVTDLKQEVKCFTNNTLSVYSVTVNVNQLDPNTRNVVNAFSAYTVGHTFLTLQQDNADGTSIVRNFGFYPRNSVKPGATTDVSIFGDDTTTPFDVSLKITVSGSDLLKVIASLTSQQLKNYDLNNFNCTNSVIDALNSINVHLPSTRSGSELFEGNDPADMGEDIRMLDLNKFSMDNGNRKLVRNLSNSNNKTPPLKKGTC